MRRWGTIPIILALSMVGLALFMALKTFSASPVQPSIWREAPLAPLVQQTSLKNGVTALLAAFRPLETLGCLLVLLGSIVGVLALTPQERTSTGKKPPYESTTLSIVSGLFLPFCLVFALYLLLYGSSNPGGGIQGGVMLTACGILFFLAFGHRQFENKLHPHRFLPFGIWGLLLFSLAFLAINFLPALASPAGTMPMEVGLLASVGAILLALFWALAQEEE